MLFFFKEVNIELFGGKCIWWLYFLSAWEYTLTHTETHIDKFIYKDVECWEKEQHSKNNWKRLTLL